jgi:Uma2 family endonuclease
MLPEGTLAELVNGQLYMSPAPNTNHQRASGKIGFELRSFIEQHSLGETFHAPYDVYLDDEENAVQPDIVFVSTQNSSIIKPHGIVGVPDLVIEFLSTGNNKHDLITKKELYERFGVKEYWIIDPSTKESIVYKLRERQFQFELAEQNVGKLFSPMFNQIFQF